MIDKVLFLVLAIATTINAQSYVAAVIEYAPVIDASLTAEENVLRNVQQYSIFIGQARTQSANIIVFPEYGLTGQALPFNLSTISTNVPQASSRIAPCDNTTGYSKFFIDLSCAAREHGVHTVVNLIESEVRNNTNGTSTTIFYNTNVVFDGTGIVIARYRKINLFGEPELTAGNEVVTFSAFDVTFGLITCFDIAFRRPAQEIFNSGVTDVIYPMAWPSETPFIHALQVQDGYAKAMGVNLLVSGYNDVANGFAGAGIFLANSSIAVLSLESAAVQNLIFATVNRITTRTPQAVCDSNLESSTRSIGGTVPDITTSLNTIHENMENYTFQALDTNASLTQGQICSGIFCCNYTIEISNITPFTANSTVYKVVAFFGTRGLPGSTAIETIGVKVCALVACTSNADSDCGRLNGTTNVNFRRITLTTTDTNNTIFQPTTLTFNHRPLENYAYCTNQQAGVLNVTMTASNPLSLFSFGIFGRVFDADGQPQGRSGANAILFSIHTILAVISVYFCLEFVY